MQFIRVFFNTNVIIFIIYTYIGLISDPYHFMTTYFVQNLELYIIIRKIKRDYCQGVLFAIGSHNDIYRHMGIIWRGIAS